MTTNRKRRGTLRVALCETGYGLYYATYPNDTIESDMLDEPDMLELPIYGLGTCATHVKRGMKKSIRLYGCETIV